ncbi:unnamed protein product, partial [marine sediment metagenome]|uniref:Uncharacterized protein n=1 Tax=marine sediment metagenome TaxID=412755 RepID=X1QPR7_9ZZZZ
MNEVNNPNLTSRFERWTVGASNRSDAANCLFYTEMIDKATLKHYGNP